MDRQLSDKIRIAGLLCAVMVVFRHSLNLTAFFGEESQAPWLSFTLEHGVSKLTEIAVPYFFAVSGYFFLGRDYYAKGAYVAMLKKKARTLVVPFLLWNVIGLVPLMLTHKFIVEDEPWRYALQLLHSDWNGVLWYVRDLITLMVLVPLYGWIFRLDRWWLYAVVGLWLFSRWIPVDCSWMSSEGLLFFFLGGVLQRKGQRSWTMGMPVLVVATAAWLVSCFAFPFYWPIHGYNTLLGLCVFWCWMDRLPQACHKRLLPLAPLAFFIYVCHSDIVKAMKVALAHVFPANEMVALTAYVVLPFIATALCIAVAKGWEKVSPRTFLLVTGGRGENFKMKNEK